MGTLEPGEFLPLVREHGLMDAVTDLVLSRAVADASGWQRRGTEIPVAINLWARSLDEDTLPDRIMSVLDAHGMPASLLTVEITEELVVADFAKGRAVLNRLREAGIRVSIDDFGSGYSTLTYLRELPIDEVKLDRQLIAPILLRSTRRDDRTVGHRAGRGVRYRQRRRRHGKRRNSSVAQEIRLRRRAGQLLLRPVAGRRDSTGSLGCRAHEGQVGV